MVPARCRASKSLSTAIASSAVRMGDDEPPGMTAFRVRPSSRPPAWSKISSRSGMPSGTSYTPGLRTRPLTHHMRVPRLRSGPMLLYHSAPCATMWRTLAKVSTLFTTVGMPKAPMLAGNGGLMRG